MISCSGWVWMQGYGPRGINWTIGVVSLFCRASMSRARQPEAGQLGVFSFLQVLTSGKLATLKNSDNSHSIVSVSIGVQRDGGLNFIQAK